MGVSLGGMVGVVFRRDGFIGQKESLNEAGRKGVWHFWL